MGPWDHLPLLAPAASRLSHSAGPLLTSVSLSPYIFISVNFGCLLILISLSITNYLVACPLPGHQGGQEVMWLRHLLAMPRPAQSTSGSTHFTYIIICISYSVNVTCKLWFVCCFLYTRHLLPIRPSWKSYRSSVTLPEVPPSFSFFFYPVKRVFFSPSTWQVFPHLNQGSKDRGCYFGLYK